MLKPRKRLTKRQIKEDKLVTYYFKVNDYIKQNSRFLSSAGIGLGVVVLVFFLYTKNQQGKEQKAAVELTKARIEYLNNNYDAAIGLLQNLVDNYGGTSGAKVGTYYLASAYFNIKKFDEAEGFYRKYLDDDGDEILEAAALAGIAASLEEKEQYAEAAETYKEVATKYSESFLAPQSLYNAARCFELAGNQEEASNVLMLLIEKYPKSGIKNDAEIFLAELTSS
jgi:TolA-binding protein